MRIATLFVAYLAIGVGAALIATAVIEGPDRTYPNTRNVSTTPIPSPWIQRYAALVTMAAHNAYEGR